MHPLPALPRRYAVCNNTEMDGNDTPAQRAPAPSLDPEDYYFDGPNLVFTAAYLLKRGVCCGSGCRHCPYRGTPMDNNQRLGAS